MTLDIPSEDLLSIAMSTITTGIAIAGTLIGAIAFTIIYYRATCTLGLPWARMIIRVAPAPPEKPLQTQEEAKKEREKLERILAAIVGFFMFVFALMVEAVGADSRERKGSVEEWTFWRVVMFVGKAGVEGLIADLITGGAIRVAELG
ncbi:hypothetical protein DOTSEDRAFT_23007 [Dothistroma septosporum NZE10]|uniref:Uncharacterized protein n=1 Tax=Dothistroma septosporum (strain NZE10 / CBS 128990) TaxID=675120 RepID=N1PR53_DOTSN|nr:hypothetical protein DOTSEDRAFT_23007 [Dothistroma septosporum NZE10]